MLCWSELDWSTLTGPKYEIVAGFVEYRSPRQVNLSPDICKRMELVRYKRPRPAATLFTAFSMLVFTHEVVHTLGIGNEAAATCFALQLTGFMSRALGTNDAFAMRLEVLLTGWYRRNLAPGYWSAQCMTAGGSTWSPRREAGRYLSDLGDARASPRRGSALSPRSGAS